MAKLNAAARKAMPKSSFAVPQKAGTAQGKAKGGSYPIPDKSHAQNALARSSGKPVESQVKAAVKKKFPGMKVGNGKSKAPNAKKAASNISDRISRRKKNKSSVGF